MRSPFHRSLFTVHALSFPPVRTGVRVAEGAGLENRYTRKGIVGSNPTLSVLVLRNPIQAPEQSCDMKSETA
jgi:hypothetical protein